MHYSQAPPSVLGFYEDTLVAGAGQCVLIRFFTQPSAKLATPEKKQSLSTFASFSVSAGPYEVINNNDVIMGQILSNGLEIRTDPPTTFRRVDVCFEKLETIPEDPRFPFRDVVRVYAHAHHPSSVTQPTN